MVTLFFIFGLFLAVANYMLLLALLGLIKSVDDIERRSRSVYDNSPIVNTYRYDVFFASAVGYSVIGGISIVIDCLLLFLCGLPPMALTLVFLVLALCLPHLIHATHVQIARIESQLANCRETVHDLRQRYQRGEPAVTSAEAAETIRKVSFFSTGRFSFNKKTKTVTTPTRKLIR